MRSKEQFLVHGQFSGVTDSDRSSAAPAHLLAYKSRGSVRWGVTRGLAEAGMRLGDYCLLGVLALGLAMGLVFALRELVGCCRARAAKKRSE